jgi:hypothetical protein
MTMFAASASALVVATWLVQQAPAPKPTTTSPATTAAPPTNCKTHGAGPCCDPAIAQHLSRQAIFAACRETAETFLGEKGGKDTCRYVFKAGAKGAEATAQARSSSTGGTTGTTGTAAGADTGFVEVYAPRHKQVPAAPTDPFFAWSRVGKAFVTSKALSPKSAPMLTASTGIWLPGDGYYVSVNASTKVCTKAETLKLAKQVR